MVLVLVEGHVVDRTLDCRGLFCPLPIVRMKRAMAEMGEGEVLEVQATDPGSRRDFEAWCRKTGNTLLAVSEEGGVLTYVVRKGGP
jgi:tRNA 2-thiouridine synthesizing protein A